MPTRWEALAGDTDVFAVKVAFMDDPDGGRGVDEDLWRSWGAFQIWVEGTNLCSHLEEAEFCPTLPGWRISSGGFGVSPHRAWTVD